LTVVGPDKSIYFLVEEEEQKPNSLAYNFFEVTGHNLELKKKNRSLIHELTISLRVSGHTLESSQH
jgi:hypothetical protein